MPKPIIKTDPGVPSPNWALPQLAEYVLTSLGEIQRAGRYTASQTYRIGRALFFAHQKLAIEAKWGAWLDEQGIPYATAWEAIKLYQAVKNEDDLASLTSTEAKAKFGIYKEYAPSSSNSIGGTSGGGGGGGGSSSSAARVSSEEKLDSAFRRMKDAAEGILAIAKWSPSLLYSTEADECLTFAKTISDTILAQRKQIPPSKQPRGVKEYLSSLEKL